MDGRQRNPVEEPNCRKRKQWFASRSMRLRRDLASRGTEYKDARRALMHSLGGIPIARPAKPREVTHLVAFLASYIPPPTTGAEYVIDGGTAPTLSDSFGIRF